MYNINENKGKERNMDRLKIIAPSRMHNYYSEGGYFSSTDMVDTLSRCGFEGIDMSLENIGRFDGATRAVLYNTVRRAKDKKISLDATHLSFYMPEPDSEEFTAKYVPELKEGIDSTAFMGIKYAVIHPVAYYSSRKTLEEWILKNVEFLSPLVLYANERGVRLLVENMSGHREKFDHMYGSTASEIRLLAKVLDCGNCWDTGHANITGLNQGEEILLLEDTLELIHIHDNDGVVDDHKLPRDKGCTVNWCGIVAALGRINYCGAIEMEIRTSHMPRDIIYRSEVYKLAYKRGQQIRENILRNR